MGTDRPVFGELSFYQALADALNDDAKWLGMATEITYSMIHVYAEPLNRTFFLNFEGGKLTEVAELQSKTDREADFVITGKPENWQAVITKKASPMSAMTLGKLKVEGKMAILLKHANKFNYMIEKMTTLDTQFPS